MFQSSIMMATQQQGAEQPSTLLSLVPFILLFVAFYFIFIRPQTKKQKVHQEMITSLEKGDKVITSGGLIGVVVGVAERTVTLRFGENFKAEVGKDYIAGKVSE